MTTSPSQKAHPAGYLCRWRKRRQERRRLAREDRLTAQLAALHHIQTLIAEARSVVVSGWVQHGWFAYRDERGQQCAVSGPNLQRMAGRPVTGACLVGAIAHAGGGLAVPDRTVRAAAGTGARIVFQGAPGPGQMSSLDEGHMR